MSIDDFTARRLVASRATFAKLVMERDEILEEEDPASLIRINLRLCLAILWDNVSDAALATLRFGLSKAIWAADLLASSVATQHSEHLSRRIQRITNRGSSLFFSKFLHRVRVWSKLPRLPRLPRLDCPPSSSRVDRPYLTEASQSSSPASTLHTALSNQSAIPSKGKVFSCVGSLRPLLACEEDSNLWPQACDSSLRTLQPCESCSGHMVREGAQESEGSDATDAEVSSEPWNDAGDLPRPVGLPTVVSWRPPPFTKMIPASYSRCFARRRRNGSRNNPSKDPRTAHITTAPLRRDDPRHRRRSVLPSLATRLRARAVQRNIASYCGTIWQLPTYMAPEDNVIKWGRAILATLTLQRPTPRLIHIGTISATR